MTAAAAIIQITQMLLVSCHGSGGQWPVCRRSVAGLSPQRPKFDSRSVGVRFLVSRLALELVFLQVEKQGSYTVYLLYSLSHTITLYCTAVLVESLILLLCNLHRFRSDVKSLTKARMCSLVKPDDISYVMVMDECEAMVK
jgi:hypothetical protein